MKGADLLSLDKRRAWNARHPCVRHARRITLTTIYVGMTGFEPATPRSQSECATKLRHIPAVPTGVYLVGSIALASHTERLSESENGRPTGDVKYGCTMRA